MRLALVLAAAAAASCGSVTAAGVDDAGAGDVSVLPAGDAAPADQLVDHGAGALEAGNTEGAAAAEVAGDAPSEKFGGSDVDCAGAVRRAGYVAGALSCAACKFATGQSAATPCRNVVDCVASDPHYSPLVETCNMTVGSSGARDEVYQCAAALIAAACR